jgi:hypothetical protein
MRGLAVIAVAMSAPPGTTLLALCRMLPAEVLALRMPRCAWKWVLRWLHARRAFLGSASDHQPWVTFLGSAGKSKQVGWAACQTLHRAGLPGWRISKILKASWPDHHRPVPLHRSWNYLLAGDSPLRQLGAG